MKAGTLLTAVCLTIASASLAAAQLYQWKDAQGRTVYSDQPPPPSIHNAQQKSFKGNVIEIGDSYALKTAREKFPITLYASACGAPCDQARQLLTERGVPFSNKDPQANPSAQAELQKLTGRSSVPVLVVGSDKIDGFETGQWQAMLDRAGYPKSAPPGRKPAPQTAVAPAPAAP
ncbi:MAG TPA: glutaredoxin family protein [Thiobacillus sp.]|jgi:glutaredoxin|nr:glutaredoxin family protein [Thiobacillus sp.]